MIGTAEDDGFYHPGGSATFKSSVRCAGDALEAEDGAALLLTAKGVEVGACELLEKQATTQNVFRSFIKKVWQHEVVFDLLPRQLAFKRDFFALTNDADFDIITDKGTPTHNVADTQCTKLGVLIVSA